MKLKKNDIYFLGGTFFYIVNLTNTGVDYTQTTTNECHSKYDSRIDFEFMLRNPTCEYVGNKHIDINDVKNIDVLYAQYNI